MPSKIANPQKFLNYAGQLTDDAIRKVCIDRVRHEFCESFCCEKFPDCDVAQHDVEVMRRCTWCHLAGMN
jgi:hypothetical protein